MHVPVLYNEVIEGLHLSSGDTVLDGTLGGAGHAAGICDRIGKDGHLIGMDADKNAIERAGKLLSVYPCKKTFVHANFRTLYASLHDYADSGLDAALFDLGLSSFQLEGDQRGFSFNKQEPLLMTFDDQPNDGALTAREIVGEWREESLIDIISGFGGERQAKRIASAICVARERESIKTSQQLAGIIEEAIPRRGAKIHPATRTFQALRIAVNDELGALDEMLPSVWSFLASEGRLAVISFHEGEDRRVKIFMKNMSMERKGILVTKRPVRAEPEELEMNKRSRSAKLRIIEKI